MMKQNSNSARKSTNNAIFSYIPAEIFIFVHKTKTLFVV